MSNQSALRLGFHIGDRFTVNGSPCFDDGSIVELRDDIGSSCPLFNLISGGCRFTDGRDEHDNRVSGAFTSTRHVTKIEDSAVTKILIGVGGLDVTAGKEYPVFEIDGREYFKDDVGDERSVRAQLLRGATYKQSPSTERGGFKPGDRVEATERLFQGDVPSGTRGTVIPRRDSGVNVRWDNGYSFHNGSATVNPEAVRKVTDEQTAPWASAPEWATHYGIEPTGRHFWFNLPPIELDKQEFRRGLDNRRGNRNREITPKRTDHNGKFYVEARPVSKPAAPEVTPQSEAKYLVRILKCQNSLIHGSFVESYREGAASFTGDRNADNRDAAKRFSYAELTEFLRSRAEHDKDESFEVVLDYIKTGAVIAPPEPKRGNNGWTVGTKLRCDFSGHPRLLPRKTYIVTRIDGDGDEVVRGEAGELLAKYGSTERNEYSVISEGK